MIRRMRESSVGIVIDEDIEEISFCQECQKQGITSKLKERLYLDDKGHKLPNPPQDAEQFRQCWTCGLIIPTREVMKQGTIQGIQGVEILASPYDSGTVITGDSSRLKDRMNRLKQRKNKHEDKEIQTLIEAGWELTNYQTDKDTLY